MAIWLVTLLAVAYGTFLYVIAQHADRRALFGMMSGPRPFTYALGLAVFCTSWTFYGSVGMAANRGLDFLTIYVGPILVFLFGHRMLERIVTIGRNERTGSTADFIAARYGKNYGVALAATLILVIGIVPYVALQLQAIANSFELLTRGFEAGLADAAKGGANETTVALPIALGLGLFAILFGTRHADATEHQDGMFIAIAFESVVKFSCFIAVGAYVMLLPGVDEAGIADAFSAHANAGVLIAKTSGPDTLLTLTLISAFAIVLLPREFHMMVVESRDVSEMKVARWLFPAYLVGINIFVLPVAVAGLGEVGALTNPDLYVIGVPLVRDNPAMAAIAFIGGLSAATAMVIVACVALAIMISNHVVLPFFISKTANIHDAEFGDWGSLILQARRAAIICLMLLAYLYYQASTQNRQLSTIGLLSFAAIAQLGPAFVGGLYWRNANARGALLGMIAGFATWFTLLLIPTLGSGLDVQAQAAWWNPFSLIAAAASTLSDDPFVSGTLASLIVNVGFFVFGSLSRAPTAFERVQASVFIPEGQGPASAIGVTRLRVTIGELRATVANYLGPDATDHSFEEYFRKSGIDARSGQLADAQLVRFSEQLLGRAVGSASARLILSLLTERRNAQSAKTLQLLGEASEALQHNRGLLQTALDQVSQGICVLDSDFRLTFWNRRLFELLELPDSMQQVGLPLRDLRDALVQSGHVAQRDAKTFLAKMSKPGSSLRIEGHAQGRVIEIQTNRMPGDGIVASFSDVTDTVRNAIMLMRANEELENRVERRTAELLEANRELGRARMQADHANAGKTRFLAAAGHDILQPLNAARLYTASLLEDAETVQRLPALKNIDAALGSVESILGAVLEISRLDAGAMKARIMPFPADRLLTSLRSDFAPLAQEKGLRLRVQSSGVTLNSDRNLLRRLVQNLVSNAIKYTPKGKVLVGIRRRGHMAHIEVYDTGIGMSDAEQQRAFMEFTRLDAGARQASGLGLGLSIVERIAAVLGVTIELKSQPGKGTRVRFAVPLAPAMPASSADIVPLAQPARMRLDGTRVLCVDNDPTILDGQRALLERWGCVVATAAGSENALAELQKAKPAILLVDYHLNNETGLEVIAKLRAAASDPRLAACLVTADRSPSLARSASELNIDVLNKPVKPAALRSLITSAAGSEIAAE